MNAEELGEYRFTDTYVRANRDVLQNFVEEYLNEYFGEFPPLLEARRAISRGEHLTVAQVRVVLNCIRHDRNWTERLAVMVENVSSRLPVLRIARCEVTEPHLPHGKCRGIRNNREARVEYPVTVKSAYIKARQGMQIHTPMSAFVFKYPNQYGPGYYRPDDFYVNTLCRTPGRIRFPIIYKSLDEVLDVVGTNPHPYGSHRDRIIHWCPTCFPGVN